MHHPRAAAWTGTPGSSRFPRFVLVVVGLASLVLAACSAPAAPSNGVVTLASAAPGSSAAPSASPADPEQAMLDYSQCMRDHGIDMPDPVFFKSTDGGKSGGFATGPGPSGNPTNPKALPGFKAADTACKHFLANITQGGGDGKPMTAAEQDAFLHFSSCMRDHGIDMPDPQFNGGGVSIQIGSDDGSGPRIDPQSPAFQAAQEACQHILTDAGLKGPGGPDSAPTPS